MKLNPEMGITEKYRLKLINEIDKILNNNSISPKEAHSLYGKLSFPITNTLGKTINVILAPITARAYADFSTDVVTTRIKQALISARFIITNLKDKILVRPDKYNILITDAAAKSGTGCIAIFLVDNIDDDADDWRFKIIRIIVPSKIMDDSVSSFPINILEMISPIVGIKIFDIKNCIVENLNDNRSAEVSLWRKASKKAVLDSLGVLTFRLAHDRKLVVLASRTKSKKNISDLGTRSSLWRFCLENFSHRIIQHKTIDLRDPGVRNRQENKWLVDVMATKPIVQQMAENEDILDQLSDDVRTQVKWFLNNDADTEFDKYNKSADSLEYDAKDTLVLVSDDEEEIDYGGSKATIEKNNKMIGRDNDNNINTLIQKETSVSNNNDNNNEFKRLWINDEGFMRSCTIREDGGEITCDCCNRSKKISATESLIRVIPYDSKMIDEMYKYDPAVHNLAPDSLRQLPSYFHVKTANSGVGGMSENNLTEHELKRLWISKTGLLRPCTINESGSKITFDRCGSSKTISAIERMIRVVPFDNKMTDKLHQYDPEYYNLAPHDLRQLPPYFHAKTQMSQPVKSQAVEELIFRSSMLTPVMPDAKLWLCKKISDRKILQLIEIVKVEVDNGRAKYPVWKSLVDTPYVYTGIVF